MVDLIEALELIAAGPRPDGTWNRDREACRQLAEVTLAKTLAEAQSILSVRGTPWPPEESHDGRWPTMHVTCGLPYE